MLTLPQIIDRPAQPYAFISFTVTMEQMKEPADQGFPELFDYLAGQGITPIAAPFYNYRRIDMTDTLDVEAGVPVDRKGSDSDRVHFGELPAGRFVTLDWYGPYDDLMQVTAVLIGWARLTETDFDMHEAPDGDHFACRLEIYETDPSAEPDTAKWLTRLTFKLRE